MRGYGNSKGQGSVDHVLVMMMDSSIELQNNYDNKYKTSSLRASNTSCPVSENILQTFESSIYVKYLRFGITVYGIT